MADDVRFTIDQLNDRLRKGVSEADAGREEALEDFLLLRAASESVLIREHSRLKEVVGAEHESVAALARRIEASAVLSRHLADELLRSGTSSPAVDARTWVLEGRVLAEDPRALTNHVVALYGSNGVRIDRADEAPVDALGRFALRMPAPDVSPKEGDAAPSVVYARVLDAAGRTVARSGALTPSAGEVEYVELEASAVGSTETPSDARGAAETIVRRDEAPASKEETPPATGGEAGSTPRPRRRPRRAASSDDKPAGEDSPPKA